MLILLRIILVFTTERSVLSEDREFHLQKSLVVMKQKCPGLEVIKLFSCSTQLSMKFFQLINVKMPTIVDILTIMSRKNSFLGLSEPKKAEFLDILILVSM